eukprot:CAMPEP_0118652932 /NCGR_PEP_ID=MMETSP0785-20121206/11574_1 /TAXON_ID=91992 /ORGANISM="Bolidomonas pacifica, Strain CCMP 1866" /LENGTH=602 /DNA_ID=CAMNT_0006545467 /DNA_START=243 /DNA_END=2051 /DNA_ORIENTATION=-
MTKAFITQPANQPTNQPTPINGGDKDNNKDDNKKRLNLLPRITPSTNPKFGDYQCNAALSLTKPLSLPPREIASTIISSLPPQTTSYFEEPEIAGPGFINLRLSKDYLSRAITLMSLDRSRLCVNPTPTPQLVVVDYSSPNIAKEMHVGHLRSTIIGHTIGNILTFLGNDVKRFNHVGDWGTQFGMLVEHIKDVNPGLISGGGGEDDVEVGDLVEVYKSAKKRFDEDESFKKRAREGVVKLQGGEEESLKGWRRLCEVSRKEYGGIYDTLGIQGLEERGESYYNDLLPNVVSELSEIGMAVESEGATVVWTSGEEGEGTPLLIRKTDGGYNYATTDLAAIKQRVEVEKAERIVYVTDSGQGKHFEGVFKAAEKAGWTDGVEMTHVGFGLVQGEDGKKFATRSGETVKLKDLLDEAVSRTRDDMIERKGGGELTEEEEETARIVGIGAVKYADLSMNRESNYKFSYSRMLSLQGNTAPYMLYARTRVCSIVRKAQGLKETDEMVWPEGGSKVILDADEEIELARHIVKFGDIIKQVGRDLYPNILCDYLFELSQKFSTFYENCPVNQAETEELKKSRLTLAVVTNDVLKKGMDILGIEVVERM